MGMGVLLGVESTHGGAILAHGFGYSRKSGLSSYVQALLDSVSVPLHADNNFFHDPQIHFANTNLKEEHVRRAQ
jgi:hypothetical protein